MVNCYTKSISLFFNNIYLQSVSTDNGLISSDYTLQADFSEIFAIMLFAIFPKIDGVRKSLFL